MAVWHTPRLSLDHAKNNRDNKIALSRLVDPCGDLPRYNSGITRFSGGDIAHERLHRWFDLSQSDTAFVAFDDVALSVDEEKPRFGGQVPLAHRPDRFGAISLRESLDMDEVGPIAVPLLQRRDRF